MEYPVKEIHRRLQTTIATCVGLPNERYTDKDAFIADREQVVGRAWACIGFVDDLPEPNYALPVNFMGLPLVITRDQHHDIRVFHNVCSHRGMHLTEAPCSTNGLLRCPYHSWTYKMDGELRGTPHIGGFGEHTHPEFDRSKHGLKSVRSALWLGAIFINLSGDAIDFEDYVAPLTAQFDALCSAEDRAKFTSAQSGCRTTMTVQSNWKLPVENYLESYHLPSVHPELNKTSPLDEHFNLETSTNSSGQGSKNYTLTVINDKHLPLQQSWPKTSATQALYPVLYPNTFIGLHSDQLFIMYLQPTAHDETIEHVRISYVGEEALDEQYQAHREHMLAAWTNVFTEDVFAVERMQKGRFSPGYTGGAFSPVMDLPTVHFHRWVADQLLQAEENSQA